MTNHLIINKSSVSDPKLWNYLKSISVKSGFMTKDLVEKVCCYKDLEITKLLQGSRVRIYTEARYWISFLGYEVLKTGSLETIGMELNRDHASIIHGLKTFRRDYAHNKRMRMDFDIFVKSNYPQFYELTQDILKEVDNG